MPVFEYQCETCNQTFEVLQKNSTPYTKCSEINLDCEKESSVKKLVSGFAFSGFSSTETFKEISTKKEASSVGCGCHGTASCPGSSLRSKYGLD